MLAQAFGQVGSSLLPVFSVLCLQQFVPLLAATLRTATTPACPVCPSAGLLSPPTQLPFHLHGSIALQVWWTQRNLVVLVLASAFMLPLCFPRTLGAISGGAGGGLAGGLGVGDRGKGLVGLNAAGRGTGRHLA